MATLVEFCEPLFQYICRLNRLARKGGLVDASQVRNELRSMLAGRETPGRGRAGWASTSERSGSP
jgi:hypothetical protein